MGTIFLLQFSQNFDLSNEFTDSEEKISVSTYSVVRISLLIDISLSDFFLTGPAFVVRHFLWQLLTRASCNL